MINYLAADLEIRIVKTWVLCKLIGFWGWLLWWCMHCRFSKRTICCNWPSGSRVLWDVESGWVARLCFHSSRLQTDKCFWRSTQCRNFSKSLGEDTRDDWPSLGCSGEADTRGTSWMQIWHGWSTVDISSYFFPLSNFDAAGSMKTISGDYILCPLGRAKWAYLCACYGAAILAVLLRITYDGFVLIFFLCCMKFCSDFFPLDFVYSSVSVWRFCQQLLGNTPSEVDDCNRIHHIIGCIFIVPTHSSIDIFHFKTYIKQGSLIPNRTAKSSPRFGLNILWNLWYEEHILLDLVWIFLEALIFRTLHPSYLSI